MSVDIAIREAQTWLAEQYKPAEITTLRRYICKPQANGPTPTDVDLMFFVQYCQQNNLDPFQKQAHLIMTNRGPEVCLGIDALRGRAAATGDYAGQDLPKFLIGDDGLECHMVVYRMVKGVRCPFPAVAWLKESKGRSPNWQTREKGMLEKCAEAKALRKAFPRECGAFYAPEEIDGYERDTTPGRDRAPRNVAPVSDINQRLKQRTAATPAAPVIEAEYESTPASDTGAAGVDGARSEPPVADDLLPAIRSMAQAFDKLGGVTQDQLFARIREVPGRENVKNFGDITEEDLKTLREWYAQIRESRGK